MIVTFSVEDGGTGSRNEKGERSHGHDATDVEIVGEADTGESEAPMLARVGAPRVSTGVEQPVANERHENGGVVAV